VSSITEGIITPQRTIRSAHLSTAFRLYADGFRGGITGTRGESTFFAVANPSTSPLSITVQLTTTTPPPPTVTLTTTLTIPGNGQVVSYLEDIFADQDINVRNGSYGGVIRITSVSPMFAGYSPSLILFRTADSQSTSGDVQFFSQDGSPVDPATVELH
jgi:hypothetical protein